MLWYNAFSGWLSIGLKLEQLGIDVGASKVRKQVTDCGDDTVFDAVHLGTYI